MVKLRLARRGRKKQAIYDIVIADARSPRDGKFIAKIGTYNPNTNPASIILEEDKAFDWLMKGAQPTDTMRAILSYKGILYKKHLQIGVNKGAITQEEADKKLAEWMSKKEGKIQTKVDTLSSAAASDKKSRLEAEAKVKEARTEAIKQKEQVDEPAAEEEVVAATEEAPAAEAGAEESTEA